jgi:hypothetical protein
LKARRAAADALCALEGEVTEDQKQFSEQMKCGHCGNVAPMEIRTTLSQVKSNVDPRTGCQWDAGPVHELLSSETRSG